MLFEPSSLKKNIERSHISQASAESNLWVFSGTKPKRISPSSTGLGSVQKEESLSSRYQTYSLTVQYPPMRVRVRPGRSRGSQTWPDRRTASDKKYFLMNTKCNQNTLENERESIGMCEAERIDYGKAQRYWSVMRGDLYDKKKSAVRFCRGNYKSQVYNIWQN